MLRIMEAPLHKPCGTRHWSTQPCPLDTKATKAARIAIADEVIAAKKAAPTKAKKSTAARKDVLSLDPRPVTPVQQSERELREATAGSARGEGESGSAAAPEPNAPSETAGTQAPPVDTSKRGPGRPRLANPKSKRAAYQRELMRKRYAAKKSKPL